MGAETISVFLADDNLIVREGVKALLDIEEDLNVVGVAADYDELVAGAEAACPQVVVTDIRMPPTFQREGIEAAREVRKRHPGTGVVILSQYDDPEYAISLLAEGSSGYAYLLKDRVGEGDQLARAVREVAGGGTMLDPKIVEALTTGIADETSLGPTDDELLRLLAEGRDIKAIALARGTTPEAVDDDIEQLFVALAAGISAGNFGSLERLKKLHQAIIDRREQGDSLSRLLPEGIAEHLRERGHGAGETDELEVTVLMSDIRGYTTIAEHTHPSDLARQLSEHRAAMSNVVATLGGTVMQFAGDAVMAVFGAPVAQVDHADHALAAARAMHAAQADLNGRWRAGGREPFELGIGLSSGDVAAALLGSEERLEYTVVGDTVNLAQRLQQWARPGETVLSDPTWYALSTHPDAERIDPAPVKGREAPIGAYRLTSTGP